jgi:K+-transporting ATPase ATPase A chain
MTVNGWIQFRLFSGLLLLLVKPLGIYIARVLEGESTPLDVVLRPVERLIYKIGGVDAEQEMTWRQYAAALLGFSVVSLLLTYLFERAQGWAAWSWANPQKLPAVEQALAWSTAASFTTNTNWQSYVPEATMSYLTQMAGLAYHNFGSAAVGIAVALAFVRGIKRTASATIGNFWVDTTRSIL